MSHFLDIALPLAEKGFRVFPLIPKTKRPLPIVGNADHFDAATVDAEQIRLWAAQKPDANVGLSPDEIWCFLETDEDTALREACADLPVEIWDTTRVSARENRCYYVFRQTMRTRKAGNMTKERQGLENLFELKIHRVYVCGPGSIHEKTGKPYGVEWRNIPAMPDVLLNRLCELYGAPKATDAHTMSEETKQETEKLDRFLAYYEVPTLDNWFNKGKVWYRPIECPWGFTHENGNRGNSTCVLYVEGGGYSFDCKHRCSNKEWPEFRAYLESQFPSKPRFAFLERGPEVSIGKAVDAETPKDWRSHYHTPEEHDNIGPPEFLIDGFLQRQAIMGIGAFVGQKKTLLALNVVQSLCSGEPLFGRLKVVRQPTRVLYLGPENGLISFASRVNSIGLRDYLGKTFFYTTMSREKLRLAELSREEIEGAAIFIDTAVRYTEGSENDASQMKAFAELAFSLIRDGAECVILLHHSPKATTKANELTLENSFRGTGELTAFLSVALALRTQNMDDEYNSPSLIRFVKQRDFEPKPASFEVQTSRETCRMTFVEDSGGATVTTNHANKDGKQDEADAVIRRHIGMSGAVLAGELKKVGIERSKSWACARKKRLIELDYAQMQKG